MKITKRQLRRIIKESVEIDEELIADVSEDLVLKMQRKQNISFMDLDNAQELYDVADRIAQSSLGLLGSPQVDTEVLLAALSDDLIVQMCGLIAKAKGQV